MLLYQKIDTEQYRVYSPPKKQPNDEIVLYSIHDNVEWTWGLTKKYITNKVNNSEKK